VGGAPEFLFEPETEDEAARTLSLCRLAGVPVRFLGGGTNLIVGDGGVAGAVIATRRLRGVRLLEERAEVAAGESFAGLVRRAAAWGVPVLSGCPGIPGSVGGAVVMNAGGRFGTTGEALVEVCGLDERGRPVRRTVGGQDLGYRWTAFGDLLVTRVAFRRDPAAEPGPAEALYRRALALKRATQPLAARSAGCTFKNPAGSPPAGRLIEAAGLKGTRVGGAVVSPLHANFILNEDRATAGDVQGLIGEVRRRVRQRFGVDLELEPHVWS